MRVAELIEKLSRLDPNAEAYNEDQSVRLIVLGPGTEVEIDLAGASAHDRDRMGICLRCGNGISAAEILDGEQPCVPDRTDGSK